MRQLDPADGQDTEQEENTMMYEEYEDISGTYVDFDVYEKLIERMYNAVTWLDKHDFVGYLNRRRASV